MNILMNNKALVATLLVPAVLAAGRSDWSFSYAEGGRDWSTPGAVTPPDSFTGEIMCGSPENQAPINLMKPLGIYGDVYGPALPAEKDEIVKHFMNPEFGS